MSEESTVDERSEVALEVLAEISGKDREALERPMDLTADLGIDSPKALQLLVDLEDRLEIEITDEHAAQMQTVGDVLDYVGALP